MDKSWRRRQPEDSPSVSFCARKVENIRTKHLQMETSLQFIFNATIQQMSMILCTALTRIYLTDTNIKTANETIFNCVAPDAEIWTEDVT